MADPITHVRDALAELNYQIVSSVLAETTPAKMRDTVLAAQDVFSKVLAYSAAAHVSGANLDSSALTGDSAEDWNDYVGDEWDSRLQLWSSLPDARHPLNVEKWAETLTAGTGIERRFLARMGFAYETFTAGFEFRRVGSDTLFDARLQRAQRAFANG
jgi:hypothetical protein